LVANQERLMDNLSLSAERFEKFRTKYPTLLQKNTSKQIASYTVSPEFFSKMKSKLLGSSNQFKLLIRIVLTFKNQKSTTSSIV
jgi:hypothetical protein